MTNFPGGIDDNVSLPQIIDLVTPVRASSVNPLRDAILAIENSLGTDPQREFSTVRSRLDYIQDQLACAACNSEGGSGTGSISVLSDGSLLLSDAQELNFVGNNWILSTTGQRANIEIDLNLSTFQETLPYDVSNIYTLTYKPKKSDTVQMFVNGIKVTYGTEYIVLDRTATYIGSIPLEVSDIIEFYYVIAGGEAQQETKTVSFDGQTTFFIAESPVSNVSVEVFVNGQKLQYGVNYTVADKVVTITSPTLDTTDVVEVWYLTGVYGLGGGGGGDGYIQIEDEGILIEPQAAILNFIGSGVIAQSVGGNKVDIEFAPTLQNILTDGNSTTIDIEFLGSGIIGPLPIMGDVTINSGNLTISGMTTFGAILTTNSAIPSVINTHTLVNTDAVQIEVTLIGRKSDGSVNGYKIIGVFQNEGAGTVQVGSTSIVNDEPGSLGWAADFNVSGNDVRVIVTGDSGTINWRSFGTIIKL